MRFQALALGAFVAAGLCAPHAARAQAMPTVEAKRDWKIGVRAETYYDNNISRSNKSVAISGFSNVSLIRTVGTCL